MASGAKAGTIVLLSPTSVSKPPPPLFGASAFGAGGEELRIPSKLRNDEQVEVGLDDDGYPAKVVVTQRLVITRAGDFSFTVPAPATDVTAAPGSQAEPGLRALGIVWQGFSAGRRVLAARATLTQDANAGLPLSISVKRAGDTATVRLVDIATRRILLATGTTSLAQIHAFLDRFRRAQTGPDQVVVQGLFGVNGNPTGQTLALVAAPLRIRGMITVPGRAPLRVSAQLGGRHPLQRTIVVPGTSLPKIALRVDLLDPLEILPGRRELAAAPNAVSLLQRALGDIALSWQYRHFLASPDPIGPSRTTYLYRTAARKAVVVRPAPTRSSDGVDVLAIVLASTLGAAALGGGVVLWAHS